ncbi:hypothetical protein BZA05DRAFT_384787 [Tricharina praecox]|uniref:uncharacterized protein n=1 Tax=Tricharina praecox TaxID=43433 RepID=UPI0022204233|nr:uncharacterized protein BZA05DRAFT_384787 [Tricharina praecox]KAI5857784.1 hypothetical protein BZA05DRAFT_384787 [Tricharina praecox]
MYSILARTVVVVVVVVVAASQERYMPNHRPQGAIHPSSSRRCMLAVEHVRVEYADYAEYVCRHSPANSAATPVIRSLRSRSRERDREGRGREMHRSTRSNSREPFRTSGAYML